MQLKKAIWIWHLRQKRIRRRRGQRTKWLGSCKNMFWPNLRSPVTTRWPQQEGTVRQMMTNSRSQRKMEGRKGHSLTGSLIADVLKTVDLVSKYSRCSSNLAMYYFYLLHQLFLKCLTMTFIAEWGDRSQLATIVLAGINNVYGVIVGEWPHVFITCHM